VGQTRPNFRKPALARWLRFCRRLTTNDRQRFEGSTMAEETVATAAATPSAPAERPRTGGGPGGRDAGRKYFRRKKVCKFCVEKIDAINYKDVRLLGQFVSQESGKIVPRRLTGVCTPHQRRLTTAIKQARNIALLPFAARR